MKKKRFGKLRLNRETIRNLNRSAIGAAVGGVSYPDPNCNSIPEYACGPDSGLATECHTAEGCTTSGHAVCNSINGPVCNTGGPGSCPATDLCSNVPIC